MTDAGDLNDEFIIQSKDVCLIQVINNKEKRNIAFKINKDSIIKGTIVWNGVFNEEEVYGIITEYNFKAETKATFNGVNLFDSKNNKGLLGKKSIPILDLNEDGTVNVYDIYDEIEEKGDFNKGECVMVQINKEVLNGKIKCVLKLNKILCYKVQLKDKRVSSKEIIVIENDVLKNRITELSKFGVYTYFNRNAYVKVKNGNFGEVKDYVSFDKRFNYLIETDMEILNVGIDDVCYGIDEDFNGKAFRTVLNPQDNGISTSMKKGTAVEIKTSKGLCYGHISWMGFDKDNKFKFGITLERPLGKYDGSFYGDRLFKTERNCAKLVLPSSVIPDPRFQFEEQRRKEPKQKSNIEKIYKLPRYTVDSGNYKGIQGNLNSCYLDTSIFAMFIFNSFFENLIEIKSESNDKIKELQEILRSHIVYPLRKDQYVSFDQVRIFRDKLQELVPNGKFLENERDPEEFLETIFHLLTPRIFLLRTKLISDGIYEQKCFLTQLFYQCIPEKVKLTVLEMLTLTFLESDMLISQPPKALILQLPRHGRELKKFETVTIPSKIDITSMILVCDKVCKKDGEIFKKLFICRKCSFTNYEMTYYCEKHKETCGHKTELLKETDTLYQGKVELELVAVLCIEKTHFIAYTKTNEVTEKWIYFNSMEALEDGELIPHIRETSLHQYFQKSTEKGNIDKLLKMDIDRIEHYAFVCFYKNPALEFYNEDFNSA